ncbi:MAG: hypothetical protein NUV75_09735 [Gallionella sp.]|nr:hypothetical protein [Gallionella sp.]
MRKAGIVNVPAAAPDTERGIDMAEVQYALCSIAIINAIRSSGYALSKSQCALIMPAIAPFLDEAYRAGQQAEKTIFDAVMNQKN